MLNIGRVYRCAPRRARQAAAQAAERVARAVGGGRADLGDRHLHLAEAPQLDLEVGGRLGDATELHQGQQPPPARRQPAGRPRAATITAALTTASNQSSSCRRRWKSIRSSWLIGSPPRRSKSSAGRRHSTSWTPGGDQHVDDPGLGRLHDGHLAARAAEHVGALLVLGAHPHLEVADRQLDVSAVVAARLDHRCHFARPSRPCLRDVRRAHRCRLTPP